MVAFDTGQTLADRFRRHAGDWTSLYGYAMRGMAEDWEAGGPVREVCAGYEDAPAGAALQLRLLAGVFRLVLTGRARELEPYYPCLGGTAPAAEAWPVLQGVIARSVPELHAALELAPQTNEVGRAAALLAGLFDAVRRTGRPEVRLLELGASAGLNLLVDRFRLTGAGWSYGPADSPVQLPGAIEGAVVPAPFRVVERRGCDVQPVDPTSEEGRLLLTSFVWPFDLHRHARLAAALRVAADGPAPVDAASAADWLAGQLSADAPEMLTVVWHSITQMYWPADELARVADLLDDHGRSRVLADVGMEFAAVGTQQQPEVRTRVWRGDGSAATEELLGTAHDHGVPVRVAPN